MSLSRTNSFVSSPLRYSVRLSRLVGATLLAGTIALTSTPPLTAHASVGDEEAADASATFLVDTIGDGDFVVSPLTGEPDVSTTVDVVIGLVGAGEHDDSVDSMMTWISDSVPNVKETGVLAKVSLAASASGREEEDFGGKDLPATLTSDLKSSKNNLGEPFSQSLTILALHRAEADVPKQAADSLLEMQNDDGAFFFTSDGQDYPDVDATGIALQAMIALRDGDGETPESLDDSIDQATTFIEEQMEGQPYWPQAYSPANTAGLAGTALAYNGVDVDETVKWLAEQQEQAGGQGLPAELNSTQPDVIATAQGMMLFTGQSYLTAGQAGGSQTAVWGTILGIVMIAAVAGVVVFLVRRRKQSETTSSGKPSDKPASTKAAQEQASGGSEADNSSTDGPSPKSSDDQ